MYRLRRMIQILTVCFLLFGGLADRSAQAQTKLVFAHYMVCFPDYANGVAGYKQDIIDAQNYGIDGFVLNCGAWDATYQANVANMFTAAAQLNTGFKLFFSADMSGLTASQILNMMSTYAGNAYYFKYNSRPVLSTFAGERMAGGYGSANATWWLNNVITPLKTSGINVYFVPFFYTDDYQTTQAEIQANYNGTAQDMSGNSYPGWWSQVVDGMFYFGGGGLPAYLTNQSQSLLNTGENYATVMHNNGKTYMAPVSQGYWGRIQGGGRMYYEYEGPIGLRAQWTSIIQNQQPEWVEIVTWNDFNETYISPIFDAYNIWPYFAGAGPGYYHPHGGFDALNAYYIDWYKHYTPTTTPPPPGYVDNIYWSYRTSPSTAPGQDDPYGAVTTFNGPVADSIYIVTNLIQPATLRVTSGGVVTNYSLSNGIYNTTVPFHLGTQKFELIRSGVTKISVFGDPITSQFTTPSGTRLYDFFHTSGTAHD